MLNGKTNQILQRVCLVTSSELKYGCPFGMFHLVSCCCILSRVQYFMLCTCMRSYFVRFEYDRILKYLNRKNQFNVFLCFIYNIALSSPVNNGVLDNGTKCNFDYYVLYEYFCKIVKISQSHDITKILSETSLHMILSVYIV